MKTLTCDDVGRRIDDFLDDGLGALETEAVRAHLEACGGCRDKAAAIEELCEAARMLPRSLEPERDLWPDIAGRINGRRVVRGRFGRPARGAARGWGAVAAAAAVLVVSVVAAYTVGLRQGRPETVAAAPDQGYRLAAFAAPEVDLERARDQLLAGLEQRRDELSPETWLVVMDNLEVIDDAIARIGTALEDNPNDGRLNRQLAVAYRQQIDLLQRATRLPAEI
jgi:hypothetical protein